ncbi:DUF5980 family protein [Pseudosporangium ferrugineum]|uniref:DUF5980 family protein n=1 Tax=Pseudosporangium ferrugineum TaxID=439699 RepID=UPI0011B28567|nr:DUF5980 family protein [Pseudosporangium ferrugineum]
MSSTSRRTFGMMLAVAAGVASVAGGGVPAVAGGPAGAEAGWTLMDFDQRLCAEADNSRMNWVFVSLAGEWTSTVTFGMSGLPEGSTVLPADPVPAGSNDGVKVLGLVRVALPALPAGTGTASLWATDGVETQSVDVPLRAVERC